MTKCDDCGRKLEIGDFPFCDGEGNGHGRPVSHRPFVPYFDLCLGEHITSNFQRNQVARRLKADMRDDPSPGDLSARRDWANQMRRERHA